MKVIPVNNNKTPAVNNWPNNYIEVPNDISPLELTTLPQLKNKLIAVVLPFQVDGYYIACIDIDTNTPEHDLNKILSQFPELMDCVERSLSGRFHVWFKTTRPDRTQYRIKTNKGNIEIFISNKYVIIDKNKFPKLAPQNAIETDPISIQSIIELFSTEQADVELSSVYDDDILHLSKVLKDLYENEYITGWDIDRAIDHLFEDNKDKAKLCYSLIFGADYDEKRSEYQLNRHVANKFTIASIIYKIPEKYAKQLKQLTFKLKKPPFYYDDELMIVHDGDKLVQNPYQRFIEFYSLPITKQFADYLVTQLPRKPFPQKDLYKYRTKYIPNATQTVSLSELTNTISQKYPTFHKIVSHITNNNPDIYYAWLWITFRERTEFVPVFMSVQGVGKNLLHDGLVDALSGYGLTTTDEILSQRFNLLLIGKMFVILDEFEPSKRNLTVLKRYTGTDHIPIERKFHESFMIKNSCNFIVHTNIFDTTNIEANDRRLLLFTQETPLIDVLSPEKIEEFAKNRTEIWKHVINLLLSIEMKENIRSILTHFVYNSTDKIELLEESNPYEQARGLLRNIDTIKDILPKFNYHHQEFIKIVLNKIQNGDLLKLHELSEMLSIVIGKNLSQRKVAYILKDSFDYIRRADGRYWVYKKTNEVNEIEF